MKIIRDALLRACVMGSVAVVAASCAGPPLTLYTLGAGHVEGASGGYDRSPVIIAIPPVSLPDELDNDDILVRNGASLRRSTHGRWAARLSTEVTDRVTSQLAARRPDALVTSAAQGQTPSYRIIITISRLDVTADGHATLDANWSIVPGNTAIAARRDRATFTVDGSVATDLDVVLLQRRVMDRLSQSIDVTGLR